MSFYFDGTSNLVIGGNLGIGTTIVRSKVAIQGGMSVGTYGGMMAPANSLIVSGNIGIGTTLPASMLTVQGGIVIGAYGGITAPTNSLLVSGNIGIGTTLPAITLAVQGNMAVGSYGNIAAPANSLIVSGSIGIGTTLPTAALHVNGDISSPAFTGQVAYFAVSTPPTGWLECNGATISRTTYNRLFSVISTTYGAGDGSTTFTIPELRGEFLRGWDDSRGVDAERTFGSAQLDQFQDHMHGFNYRTDLKTGNNYTIYRGGSIALAGTVYDNSRYGSETRPRNIALLACIKI